MIRDDETQHLLRKLQKIFKDGYRPARGNESYNVKLKNGLPAYGAVNCLGHIFNLRNQQFNDYQIKPYQLYGYFPGLSTSSNNQAVERIFDFIQETGLKVEECAPNENITNFESWKIALYFVTSKWHKDFHFLLEDTPHNWSSKLGFEPYLEHYQGVIPPLQYRNLVEDFPPAYCFYGTYKLTNPNADENNKYLQDRTI